MNILLICITEGKFTSLSILYLKEYLINNLNSKNNIEIFQIEKTEVKIIFNLLINKYKYLNFDLIGFSTYVFNHIETSNLLKMIKKNNFTKKVILGGPYFSHDNIKDCLKEYNYPDYIVIGEGEIPLYNIISSLTIAKNKQFLKSSNEIFIKYFSLKNKKTIVLENLKPVKLENLSAIYKLNSDFINNETTALLDTSRGCKNSCIYCRWGKCALRFYSNEKIYHELITLFSLNINCILFIDSNILNSYKRAKFFINIIKKENKNNIPIDVFLELNTVNFKNKNILKNLIKLNSLKTVEVGLQSSSEYICNKNGRILNFDKFKKQFFFIKKHLNKKTIINLDLIIGLPFSTYKDNINSLEDAIKLKPQCIHAFLLQVLPGSQIFSNPKKYGLYFNSKTLFIEKTNNIYKADIHKLISIAVSLSMIFSFPNTLKVLINIFNLSYLNLAEKFAIEIIKKTTLESLIKTTNGYIKIYLKKYYNSYFDPKMIANFLFDTILNNNEKYKIQKVKLLSIKKMIEKDYNFYIDRGNK